MDENHRSTQQVAQIATILLSLLGFSCCFCGAIFSSSAFVPQSTPVVLPDGSVADDSFLQLASVINMGLFITIGLIITLIGVAIWFLFGRKQPTPNAPAKAFAIASFIGSFAFCLWSILVALTGILTNGMIVTGQTFGADSALFLAMFCLVPATVLALVGAIVWFGYARRPYSKPVRLYQSSMTPVNPAATTISETISLDATSYYQVMHDLLTQFTNERSHQVLGSMQNYTWQMIQKATTTEKETMLDFLYKNGLLDGEMVVRLEGADFQGVQLTNAELPNINLVGINLSAADLRGANLQGANLQRANLNQTKLHKANLTHANLLDANLTDANLWRANLNEAQMIAQQLDVAKMGFD